MNRIISLVVTFSLALIPVLAQAANRAETTILPQRLVLEQGDRFVSLIVKNSGTATGQYTTEIIDMDMNEDGTITPAEADKPRGSFSAIPYVHLAPRSFTLAPDAYQTVRAIVRRPEGMPAGEYRSHIRVRLVNDDVDATPPADNQKIIVKANLVMIVPLIVRQGETSFAASLSSPKIIPAPGGGRMLELYIERTGNRSAEGDLKVFQSQSGILKEIAAINGLPVYHETARRLVRIQLPASAENGQLTIRYQRQSGEAIEVLAEAKL